MGTLINVFSARLKTQVDLRARKELHQYN